MSAGLLVSDSDGNFFDHPGLAMAGQSGKRWEAVGDDDLIALPEGTKLFFLPGSFAVGWDLENDRPGVDNRYHAVGAMLQAGWVRSHLPAVSYPAGGQPKHGCYDFLPLWAYAAVGFKGDKLYASAFRIDPMTHSETENYDDREIAPRVEEKLSLHPHNRLIGHLSKCALEYHCFAAKNFFMQRWEAPLPIAPACNARCIGCISLQPGDCCPASQDRIDFVPTIEELSEVAVPHLGSVERGIVSFGQGCEGEPLLYGDTIEEAVKAFRSETTEGTIHLNTNGSEPSTVKRIAKAGLDSIRISMNSPVEEHYNRYYRPSGYTHGDVVESIRVAVGEGVVTALNLLVFPGFTDTAAEVEALEELVDATGLHMVHLRNLSIDPRLYVESMGDEPWERGEGIGLKALALRLKRNFPKLDLGYFNRPKETFGAPLVSLDYLLEQGER